eukprot:scaffold283_cov316-Pavlova_lutheri.AAC.29
MARLVHGGSGREPREDGGLNVGTSKQETAGRGRCRARPVPRTLHRTPAQDCPMTRILEHGTLPAVRTRRLAGSPSRVFRQSSYTARCRSPAPWQFAPFRENAVLLNANDGRFATFWDPVEHPCIPGP